jgi:hypothetical protein
MDCGQSRASGVTAMTGGWSASIWQTAIDLPAAFLLGTVLWAAYHFGLKPRFGGRRIMVRVLPGTLSIYDLNRALGGYVHHIRRCDVTARANGVEDVRLDFADLTPKLTAEILATLMQLPGASAAFLQASTLDRAIHLLEQHFNHETEKRGKEIP